MKMLTIFAFLGMIYSKNLNNTNTIMNNTTKNNTIMNTLKNIGNKILFNNTTKKSNYPFEKRNSTVNPVTEEVFSLSENYDNNIDSLPYTPNEEGSFANQLGEEYLIELNGEENLNDNLNNDKDLNDKDYIIIETHGYLIPVNKPVNNELSNQNTTVNTPETTTSFFNTTINSSNSNNQTTTESITSFFQNTTSKISESISNYQIFRFNINLILIFLIILVIILVIILITVLILNRNKKSTPVVVQVQRDESEEERLVAFN